MRIQVGESFGEVQRLNRTPCIKNLPGRRADSTRMRLYQAKRSSEPLLVAVGDIETLKTVKLSALRGRSPASLLRGLQDMHSDRCRVNDATGVRRNDDWVDLVGITCAAAYKARDRACAEDKQMAEHH